jgi:NTE family protein
VFDRFSGVDLVGAVAASTSSGTAHRIGDRAYIDGGHRRNDNADLAAGCGRAVEAILPDSHSLDAFGTDLMDPSTRRPAARAGYALGRGRAEQLTQLWH